MNYYNLRRATVAVLDRNFEKLANYCARYPAIDEWVKAITYPLSGEEEKDELAVSSALSTFLYDIGGYDIGFSRYRSISPDWVVQLNNFIGNYFLDDSYFKLTRGTWNIWQASTCPEQNSSQDPRVLLIAARENAKHYQLLDAMRPAYLRKAKSLNMADSGKVQAQLALGQSVYL